jgi:methylated-DNA-[protein]-cysteine S-methyltransferase
MLEEAIRQGTLLAEMNFDQKVWALTARIPAGMVCTYGDIARELKTKAYRAVGNALNRNPYAPAVPCHRVVGADGSLTGFAAGIEKKRKLLENEGIRLIAGDRVDLTRRYRFGLAG